MLAACSKTPCRRAFSRGRTPATTTLTAQAGVRLSSPRPPPAPPAGDRQARLSSSNSRWKQRQGSDVFAREAKVQGLKSRAAFKLLEMDAKFKLFKKGDVVVDLGYAPGSWSQVALERAGRLGRVVGIDIIPAQPPKGVSTIQGNFLSPGVQAMVKRFLTDDQRRRDLAPGSAAQAAAGKASSGRAPAIVDDDDDGEAGGLSSDEVVDRPSYIDAERAVARGSPLAGKDPAADAAEGKQAKQEKLVDVVLSDMMMNTSGNNFRDHVGSMDLCMAALTFASDTLKPGGRFVCKFYQGADDKAFEAKLKKMFRKVHREKPESSRSESKESYFVALNRKPSVTLGDAEGA